MKIEKEIKLIKERNKKVEIDKSWEVSKTRKLIIAVMTYFIVVLFMWIIEVENFWLNALVPTIGFVLSTLTLPFFKDLWVKNY